MFTSVPFLSLRTSGLFRGQCERPTVCRSVNCWGCVGLADVGEVLKRGQCHLGDGVWWVSAVLGSNSPGAAPQLACPRCRNGLGKTENSVNEEDTKDGTNYIFIKEQQSEVIQIMLSLSPAETSTTAMKRAISSGSRPKEPNFSLNSNIASSSDPMPKPRRVGKGYFWPLRKVTVRSSALNKVQNLTIRTYSQKYRDTVRVNTKLTNLLLSLFFPKLKCVLYLEGAWFEQHDLVMLAKLLKSWDALGKLYHFFHCRSETIWKWFPYLLTWALNPRYRACIERTSLKERKTR